MDDFPLWLGLLACALAVATGLAPLSRRVRLAGLSLALLLAPVIVVADNWDSAGITSLRDHPVVLLGALLGAAFAVAVLGIAMRRRPAWVVPLLVGALPFRVPVELGSGTDKLLLPLYLLIAAALVATWTAGPDPSAQASDGEPRGRGWLRWTGSLLGAFVLAYALGAGYASDLSPAVQNVGFFFAPFATLFYLLSRQSWNPAMIRAVVIVLAAEGALFAVVAIGQSAFAGVFWNEKLIEGNEAHAYFRVNSLFFDPNILGRYLAVTMLALASVVAFGSARREVQASAGLFVLLLIGLSLSYSQSSMIALLTGILVIAALRWGIGAGIAAAAGTAVALAAAVFLIGGGGLTSETTGRTGLVEGGLEIAADNPLAGAGSGSFAPEFRERAGPLDGIAVESHTEPVTILAEQGAVGALLYVALLLGTLGGLLAAAGPAWSGRARGGAFAAALLAAYVAMVVHSLGYAAFLTDPLTWAILAAASASLLPAPARARPLPNAEAGPATA